MHGPPSGCPAWVLDLPESQRLALVAGYLDSDGCAPHGPAWLLASSRSTATLLGGHRRGADLARHPVPGSTPSTTTSGPVQILGYTVAVPGQSPARVPGRPAAGGHGERGAAAAAAAGLRRRRHPLVPTVGRSQIELPPRPSRSDPVDVCRAPRGRCPPGTSRWRAPATS